MKNSIKETLEKIKKENQFYNILNILFNLSNSTLDTISKIKKKKKLNKKNMNDDLSDFDDNKIRIPQRNYLMFKDLIGNIINPLNSYYDLEIFFEQHFSNIISSSSEKIFVIFCLCILYPNLKAFFINGNHFVSLIFIKTFLNLFLFLYLLNQKIMNKIQKIYLHKKKLKIILK